MHYASCPKISSATLADEHIDNRLEEILESGESLTGPFVWIFNAFDSPLVHI